MKLKSIISTGFKLVQYFDLSFIVPESTRYIAVDKSGKINAFQHLPKPDLVMGIWDSGTEFDIIGHIDLESTEWVHTLKEIK